MNVNDITNLELQTLNEAPNDKLKKVAQGAKRMAQKLGGKGSGGTMSKAMDKVSKGEALPANLAKQIAPFAKGLEAIMSDPVMVQQLEKLIKRAEGSENFKDLNKDEKLSKYGQTQNNTKPNPKIKVAKGAGQLETGDDGETYVWAGAQWVNNSTAKMAPRAVGAALTTKMIGGIADEIKKSGIADQIKAQLSGTKAPTVGPATS